MTRGWTICIGQQSWNPETVPIGTARLILPRSSAGLEHLTTNQKVAGSTPAGEANLLGTVAEWLKALSWKGSRRRRLAGSNPVGSANLGWVTERLIVLVSNTSVPPGTEGSNPSPTAKVGHVTEWLIVPVLKTGGRETSRGFKSHRVRQRMYASLMRGRAVAAHQAHNLKVEGSSPSPASNSFWMSSWQLGEPNGL